MADGYLWSYNNAIYPTALPVVEPILAQNDPVAFVCSSYITSFAATYLAPSYAAECKKVGLTNANLNFIKDGYFISMLINNPLNPLLFESSSYKFPLACLYREGERYNQLTLTKLQIISDFVLDIIFPPLTQPQYTRLYSFQHLFSEAFESKFFRGTDPLYQNGTPVFQMAGLSWLTLTGTKYDPLVVMDAKENRIYFPKLTVRFSAYERQKFVSANAAPLSSVDVSLNLVSGEYPSIPYHFADGYVPTVPSITGISPSSGSVAGNTSLAIAGTCLTDIVSVSLCGVPVKMLLVNNKSLLLASSGPSLSAVTGDLVAIDNQGGVHTLRNVYTYTTP